MQDLRWRNRYFKSENIGGDAVTGGGQRRLALGNDCTFLCSNHGHHIILQHA